MLDARKLLDDAPFPLNRRSESSAETFYPWTGVPDADARGPPPITKEYQPTRQGVFIPAQSTQSVILNEVKDPSG
jgi:hypothetical protein